MDTINNIGLFKSIFGLLIISGLCARAQDTLYNNGEIFYVQQGALLHIEGNMVDVDSSRLFNDGVIELTGNLHNDSAGVFQTGNDASSTERCLKFIGTASQNISGYYMGEGAATIYNLVIDKAVSGQPVVLQTNVTVDGALLWGSEPSGYTGSTYVPDTNSTAVNNNGQGLVQTFTGTSDYELYLANSDPAALAGFRNYVSGGYSYPDNSPPTDGYLQNRGAQGMGMGGFGRKIQSLNSDYWFPVGSATNGYNPVLINFAAIPADSDKVRGLFVDGIPVGNSVSYNNIFNSCSAGAPQAVTFDCLPESGGYWSFAGDSQSVYYVVSFPKAIDICGEYEINNMRLIKNAVALNKIPTGDWTAQVSNVSGSLDTNIQLYTSALCYSGAGIPGGKYEGFTSHFMYTSGAEALNVALASLAAEAVNNTFIRVSWTTYSEVNNAGFKVMRSTDALNWTQLGWVNGNDNSTVTHNYAWNDYEVSYGITYYYMLVQLDNNGLATPSNTVTAALTGATTLSLSFAPNPASTFTALTINSPSPQPALIQLYDVTGNLVGVLNENISAGQNKILMDTQNLPSGLYSATISLSSQVLSGKLVVTRD